MKRKNAGRKKGWLVVGLTGGIASGKTTVLAEFAHCGAAIVDADEIGREVARPGNAAFGKIVRAFGKEVLSREGTIDRKALAGIVFADPGKRRMLERIMHPEIKAAIKRSVAKITKDESPGVVVIDVPLLFETGFDRYVDKTITVWVPEGVQLKRLRSRDGLGREEAMQRMRSQWPMDKKKENADFVIDNTRSKRGVAGQVKSLWQVLTNK